MRESASPLKDLQLRLERRCEVRPIERGVQEAQQRTDAFVIERGFLRAEDSLDVLEIFQTAGDDLRDDEFFRPDHRDRRPSEIDRVRRPEELLLETGSAEDHVESEAAGVLRERNDAR